MSGFDDLPQRDPSHETEEKALIAFRARLAESGVFHVQASDTKDYGSDCQIEVIEQGRATNVRIHVQIKGTERALNADGSLSIQVRRTNLNYLLGWDDSFYVVYHIPSDSLRLCPADQVLHQYEHGGSSWIDQDWLTVSFTEELTVARLAQLAALARARALASRDRRIAQTRAAPADVSKTILAAVPDFHVPDNAKRAREILRQLYEAGADDVISAGFERFAAVLGAESEPMAFAYMAEINRGMGRPSQVPERIEAAVRYFRSRLGDGRHETAALHYTIGNAHSALGDEGAAKRAYQAALADPGLDADPGLAAQVQKNLGTSIERLGDQDTAATHYQEALRLNPALPEAHTALGVYHVRAGRFDEAIAHLDHAVFAERSQGKMTTVVAWRANALFNLGRDPEAFREINILVSHADAAPWIWNWCVRLVAAFGRTSAANAAPAATFWARYVRAQPDSSRGRRELLMTAFYRRSEGQDIRMDYAAFRAEFDRHIAHVDAAHAALPWDRLGHWAQQEGDWAEAERCFRKAYDLAGGHYGYCLGTALNFLGRFEESLPILREQAEVLQPDAMSWFQLGVAYADLQRPDEAIDAYGRAHTLDPDHAPTAFNLGGAYWNSGNLKRAAEVWRAALAKFPEHELAERLRRQIPLFS